MSVYGYLIESGGSPMGTRSAVLIKRLDGDTNRWEPISEGLLPNIRTLAAELNAAAATQKDTEE